MSRPDATPANGTSYLPFTPVLRGRAVGYGASLACLLSTPPLIAAILLSGCESVKPLLTRSETVEVRIPIPVSCVAVGDVPAVPPTAIPLEGDIKQLAAGAAADVLALEQYAMRANALLTGCAR